MPKGDGVEADPGLLLLAAWLFARPHCWFQHHHHAWQAWGEVVCGFFCVVVMLVLQLVLEQMVLMSSPLFPLLCLCLKATSSSWVLPGGQ